MTEEMTLVRDIITKALYADEREVVASASTIPDNPNMIMVQMTNGEHVYVTVNPA